jgi:hypothetical protein
MESGSKMAVMELLDRVDEPALPRSSRRHDVVGHEWCVRAGRRGTEKTRMLEYAIKEVRLQANDNAATSGALETGFPRQLVRMSPEIR